jgi:hypothetical protein
MMEYIWIISVPGWWFKRNVAECAKEERYISMDTTLIQESVGSGSNSFKNYNRSKIS